MLPKVLHMLTHVRSLVILDNFHAAPSFEGTHQEWDAVLDDCYGRICLFYPLGLLSNSLELLPSLTANQHCRLSYLERSERRFLSTNRTVCV